MEERVFYTSELPEDADANDLVLVDEADQLLFNETDAVRERLKHPKVLAFTATISKSELESVEVKAVKVLGYKRMVYSVVRTDGAEDPGFHEMYDKEDETTLASLINIYRPGQPVLVYCSQADLVLLRARIPELIELELVEDYTDLLDTETKDGEDQHKVYATATEKSMRGLDFRAPRLGMTLLVAAPFSTPRDLSQGLSRVGRFGDSCLRVKVGAFEDVDRVKNADVMKRLLALVAEARLKKETYAMKNVGKKDGNKR